MKFSKQRLYLPTLAVAGALFIYSAVFGAPREVIVRTNAMLANVVVGTSAAVEPNSYNSLAQQLTDKEKELRSREENIAQQENQNSIVQDMPSNLSLYSFLMSLILLILVGINFFFDWRRGRSGIGENSRSVINLRSRG